MRNLWRYAWMDIGYDWVRALVTVLGLAVLVFSYHLLISLSQTFAEFSVSPATGRNLVVIQAEVVEPSDARLDPAAVEAARALGSQSIARVSPVMFRAIRTGDHLVHLRAAPQQDWIPLYQLRLLEGSWPAAKDEIAAGEGAARANHWTVGSNVRVYGSDFRVSAILGASGTYFASIWMPLDTAQELFGPDTPYQGMYIQPAAQADADELRARLQELPELRDRYTVFYEDSYTHRNNQALKDINSLARIAAALALLAVIFGVSNAVQLSLFERSREIGCMRAIGFTHRTVRLFLLTRSLILACLAYLLGLATAGIYMLIRSADDLVILGFPLSFRLSAPQAGLGFCLTILLAGLGAWLSGRRLASAGVGDLLREEVS